MSVPEGLVPSLLLPEVQAPWKAEPGFLLRQVERAARDGFSRAIEIGPIADPADRAAIRELCRASGIGSRPSGGRCRRRSHAARGPSRWSAAPDGHRTPA